MTERLWKKFERSVAALLGGRRVPITGRNRGDAPDIEHPLYAVEVKHDKSQRVFVANAMTQAKACVRPGQIPLVVIGVPGVAARKALVVMELGDFADHFGGRSRSEDCA